MFKLFVLFLLVGGWALSAAALHVVRTPANLLTVTVIPKNELSFEDTYVDTRQWTMEDVPKHDDLVRRIITTGRSDVLAHVADPKSGRDVPTQLADALGDAAATAAAAPAAKSPSPSAISVAMSQFKAGKLRADELAKMVAGTR
jgi:hypothetical protein